MRFRFFCLLLFVFNTLGAQGADTSLQEERFLPSINRIGSLMATSNEPSEVMEALIKRGARVPAFNVQGMARFYRKKFDFFKGLHRDFKIVEDFVGKIDQWENELRKANEKHDDQRVEKAEDKLKELREEMAEELIRRIPKPGDGTYEADSFAWIARNGETSKTQFYARQLGVEFAERSYEEDRELLIDRQLKNVKDMVDDYDPGKFDNLELDNGIHPFRKDLRWILIEMRVSNGFFAFDPNPNNCDIEGFKGLPFSKIAKNKYARLVENNQEPAPCFIQQCVFLGVADLQNKAADIKDEIEDQDVVSEDERYEENNVPKSYQRRMERLYQGFLDQDQDPWAVFKSQLKACKN